MVPDFRLNECPSMQDMPHNDCTPLMNIPGAVINCPEREMCPLSIHKRQSNHQQQHSPIENNNRQGQGDTNGTNDINDTNHSNKTNGIIIDTRNSNELCKASLDSWQPQNQAISLIHNTQNFLYRNHRHYHQHYNRYENYSHHKLLRSSEDPLISHGAHTVLTLDDDENPIEFAKRLMNNEQIRLRRDNEENSKQINQQTSSNNNHITEIRRTTLRSGCSNLTKQQLKVKASMMSAKSRELQKQQQNQKQEQRQQQQQQQLETNNSTIISSATAVKQQSYLKIKRSPPSANQQGLSKLRFHHQALPSEYLNHYEAMQGQLQPMQPQRHSLTTSNDHQKQQHQQPPTKTSYSRKSHENVRTWLQKIAEIHRNATANQLAAVKSGVNVTYTKDKITNNTSSLDSNNNTSSSKCKSMKSSMNNNSDRCQTNHKTLELFSSNYSDLPYMGEITLDHSKPRRGRKPKKADICHLIYKNYGTTMFPQKAPSTINSALTDDSNNSPFNHMKAIGGLQVDKEKIAASNTIRPEKVVEEQPLNLCLRDHNIDTLSLTSCDDDDDITETNSSCPTPIATPSDILRDTMLAVNMKNALTSIPTVRRKTDEDDSLLRNSLTSYYQKIIENSSLIKQFHSGQLETIQKDNQLALKIPLPSGLLSSQIKMEKSSTITSRSLSPSRSNEYLIERSSTPSSIKSEMSLTAATATATTTATAAVTSTTTNAIVSSLQPQKRKRSAIYIPPVPADTSATNPANEVSICKFKFTGGAHPTLQEKKMLSVDAGGNYRYFSGTGDKASRGYDYFPRESLKQKTAVLPGMNVVEDKRSPKTIPTLLESHIHALNHNRKSIESNTTMQLLQQIQPQGQTHLSTTQMNNQQLKAMFSANNFHDSSPLNNRCMEERDSNKSNSLHQQYVKRCTHREKLEKKFKEQGFLIQTQHLESAEGATYCKFRQLKKFSRYLFRNWKDYLPEELQQQHQQQQQEQRYDEQISPATLSTSLRVHAAQQPLQNENDTEMITNDLRTSFTKSELESLLQDT